MISIKMFKVLPSIKKIGKYGSEIQLQTSFERIDGEETSDRFIAVDATINPAVFQTQQFAGAMLKYSFKNYGIPSLPTIGMRFSVAGTYKMNLDDTRSNFPALESKLSFNHKIDAKGKIVLATILKAKILFNNNYEFHQGAAFGQIMI